MPDNATACAATGTIIFATDEDGSSIHWPYTKVVFGAADVQTIVQTSAPFPVMVTHVSTGAAIAVSSLGSATVKAKLIDGSATVDAISATVNALITTVVPVTVTGGLVIASGTVEIGGDVSLTGAVAISGTAAVVFTNSSVLNSISAVVAVTVTGGLVIASGAVTISNPTAIDITGSHSVVVSSLPNVTLGDPTVDVTGSMSVVVSNSLQVLKTGIEASAGTVATVEYRRIQHGTASGSAVLITAVASKKLRLLSMQIVAGTAQQFKILEDSSGATLMGSIKLAANGGFILPPNEFGWFETAAGNGIDISCSSTLATLGGCLTFLQV